MQYTLYHSSVYKRVCDDVTIARGICILSEREAALLLPDQAIKLFDSSFIVCRHQGETPILTESLPLASGYALDLALRYSHYVFAVESGVFVGIRNIETVTLPAHLCASAYMEHDLLHVVCKDFPDTLPILLEAMPYPQYSLMQYNGISLDRIDHDLPQPFCVVLRLPSCVDNRQSYFEKLRTKKLYLGSLPDYVCSSMSLPLRYVNDNSMLLIATWNKSALLDALRLFSGYYQVVASGYVSVVNFACEHKSVYKVKYKPDSSDVLRSLDGLELPEGLTLKGVSKKGVMSFEYVSSARPATAAGYLPECIGSYKLDSCVPVSITSVFA